MTLKINSIIEDNSQVLKTHYITYVTDINFVLVLKPMFTSLLSYECRCYTTQKIILLWYFDTLLLEANSNGATESIERAAAQLLNVKTYSFVIIVATLASPPSSGAGV